MSIASGTRLGPYEILVPIGAGGMGEVYRARDSRLGRDVAIKVLPSHLSDNPELKVRFEREAKAISQLTHPHICTLHDVGSENGVDFLVMELLEGQSLADRLEKGPLPTEQVLKFGGEIADALDRAHRAGIVHRDLKPGNIMLTKSGVKLLDFGLAKAAAATEIDPELSSLPTQAAPSQPLTARGTIMGTFQYMAPEQLEGKPADARTDIFAFGCVLYEMATGKRAFTGASQASLISAIMKDEPRPISELVPLTPPAFERLVKTCLAKDPEDRWQSEHDLKNELSWISQAGSQAGAPAAIVSRRKSRELLAWAAAAIMTLVCAALGILFWNSSNRQQTVQRLSFILPTGERLVPASLNGIGFAISPDGSKIVYVAQAGTTSKLRVHFLDRDDSTEIPGTENASGPFFSPDGKWIGFSDRIGFKKVAIAGGAPIPIAPAVQSFGNVWATDGFIYFVPDASTGVFRVPEGGGAAQPVTRVRTSEGEIQHRWPDVVPGGKTILYTVGFGKDWDEAKIVAERLDTGERRIVVDGGTSPRFLPEGYLVYARAGSLYAVTFNARTLATSGAPVEVAHGVGIFLTGRALFDLTRNGILASVPPETGSILSWVDRSGHVEALNVELRNYLGGSLSPDGSRAAVQSGNSIAIADLARHTLRKLTLSARAEQPLWSADGARIYFGLEKEKFYKPFWKAADDSGEEKPLFPAVRGEDPLSVSRDGKKVLLWASTPGGDEELRIRTIGSPDPGTALVKSRSLGTDCGFSPDGTWLAYTTVDSGREEVYVRPVSGADQKWQISAEGGGSPIWSRSSKEIFYTSGARMMVVPIEPGASFSYGTPKILFENPEVTAIVDIAPDDKRFLCVRDPNFGAESKIGITTGWFSEVERKVREAKAP